MTFTSKGYDGTVDYEDWAVLTNHLGAQYSVFGADSFAVSTGAADRELVVAAGQASGMGIYDVSDAAESLIGSSVGSGDRWDTVVLQRNWALGETTPVLLQGTATKQIAASRSTDPGVQDEQPLALVRFSAGQTVAQEIVDLRCWHGDGGVVAKDLLVRSYLSRLGTRVFIDGITWVRAFDGAGLPAWVTDSVTASSTQPPYYEGHVWVKSP